MRERHPSGMNISVHPHHLLRKHHPCLLSELPELAAAIYICLRTGNFTAHVFPTDLQAQSGLTPPRILSPSLTRFPPATGPPLLPQPAFNRSHSFIPNTDIAPTSLKDSSLISFHTGTTCLHLNKRPIVVSKRIVG
jgi:hypothetical protein